MSTAAAKDVGGFTPGTLAGLTDRAAALRTAIAARTAAEKAYRSAVTAAETAHDDAEDAFRPARRQANNSAAMTPELRSLAGLGSPTSRGRTGDLPAVTDLASIVRPSGAVFLDRSGPTGGALRYEVFAHGLDEDGGEWTLIGIVSATGHTDRTALPGARTSYRVQAVRGDRRGEVSTETVVNSTL